MSEQIARVLCEGELSIPTDVFQRLKLRTDDKFLVLQDGDDIWLKRIHSKDILEKKESFLKNIIKRAIQLLDFMLDSLSEKESLTIYLGEFKEQINLLWDYSEAESDSFQQVAALLKLVQRQLKVSTVSQELLNSIKKILLGIEANKTTYSDLWDYENLLEEAGMEVVVSLSEESSEMYQI
jgi:bifunctional DNA-binding transcriptional regulator/antitoxin component of YhaV-PrlF toxin-antitoxin module